jgi:hypothetical protein
VVEVETMLRLDKALLRRVIVGIESSSPMGMTRLVLLSRANGPSTGLEMFNVIGINLAATGRVL